MTATHPVSLDVLNKVRSPLQLGSLTLANRSILAPLAGVSDIPFRRICQMQGAGLTYVEMLSATALRYRNKKTFEMLARHKDESVLGVQVTGPSASEVGEAVRILDGLGFDTIDLNMGCPVRKVVSAGCGSGILRDPERITHTVQAARAETRRPLSAKFRLGYTREAVNVEETSQRVVRAGVEMFTIHGRTRSESYDTPVDTAGIRQGFAAVNAVLPAAVGERGGALPVSVGNGDIFSHVSSARMFQETACDAVMVSRGALGNPWVFREILEGHAVLPTIEEWLDLVLLHVDLHKAHYGDSKLAAILMRKHMLWYAKGYPGSKALREFGNNCESIGEMREAIKSFAASLPKGMRRGPTGLDATDPKYDMDRVLDRGVGDEGMEASEASCGSPS